MRMCAVVERWVAMMKEGLSDTQLACYTRWRSVQLERGFAAGIAETSTARYPDQTENDVLTCARPSIRGVRALLAHLGWLVPRGHDCWR